MPIPGGPRPTHIPARRLREVADQVHGRLLWQPLPSAASTETTVDDAGEVLIGGVTLSSHTVRPADLYAALPGQRAHGADYAAAAAEAGAVAVLTDPAGRERALATGLPVVEVEAPRASLGDLAAWLYGRPAERMLTLGVTGTNGKTTTTFLLDGALRRLGRHPGLVGTVELRVDTEVLPSTGTTPEAPDLHALLAVMVEHGCDSCAMEISSHALAQHRVDALTVDVAGFTNLSQDHLDYHRTMAEYFAAKATLFTSPFAHRAVVCVDDDWGRRLADLVAVGEVPVTTVGSRPPSAEGAASDWQVLSTVPHPPGSLATLRAPDGVVHELQVPLPGDFNVANAVLAVAMLVEGGFPVADAVRAVGGAGSVPGRMEPVQLPPDLAPPGTLPLAVVDYAHTPDAITAALTALRPDADPLVVVLGAGGDRDRDKRPKMGAAAAAVADAVVVTDDNPRSEPPELIRAAVLTGARETAARSAAAPLRRVVDVIEVPDRREAIIRAVRLARASGAPHPVVLVAGKGHEQGQEVAGVVHPFDDRSVVRQALLDELSPARPGGQ